MKKVLILGSEGFIGSHLVETLSTNFEIFGIDKVFMGYNKHEYDFTKCDIAYDADAFSSCVKNIQPDVIIDSAASVGVDKFISDEIGEHYRNNIALSHIVTRSCIESNIDPLLIFFSSSEVYDIYRPYGRFTYGIAKDASEIHYLSSLRNSVCMRLFNIIGIRQNENFVVPKFVNAYLEKQDVFVTPNAKRTFCDVRYLTAFVENFIQVYQSLSLKEFDRSTRVFNFGSSNEENFVDMHTLSQLVAKTIDESMHRRYCASQEHEFKREQEIFVREYRQKKYLPENIQTMCFDPVKQADRKLPDIIKEIVDYEIEKRCIS